MSTMPDWVALLWLVAFLAVAGLLAGMFVLAGLAEERERNVGTEVPPDTFRDADQ